MRLGLSFGFAVLLSLGCEPEDSGPTREEQEMECVEAYECGSDCSNAFDACLAQASGDTETDACDSRRSECLRTCLDEAEDGSPTQRGVSEGAYCGFATDDLACSGPNEFCSMATFL